MCLSVDENHDLMFENFVNFWNFNLTVGSISFACEATGKIQY